MAETCVACPRSFVTDEALQLHVEKAHGDDIARDFNTAQRKSAAKSGAAMPDGSFPIKNTSDLKNAISAYGRAKDKAKAKSHIISRAKALKATSLLPDDWKPKDTAMTDTAQTLTFPSFGAPSYLDVKPQLQWRRIVEVDIVDGQLQTRVVQDYTAEPLGTQHAEADAANLSSETSYHCVPCRRPFNEIATLGAHYAALHPTDKADAVLTFDNIRELVREELREKYSSPFGGSCYIYVADLASDWVVYELGSSYFKASYTIDDSGNVTLGDGQPVIPRMTYLPIPADGDD